MQYAWAIASMRNGATNQRLWINPRLNSRSFGCDWWWRIFVAMSVHFLLHVPLSLHNSLCPPQERPVKSPAAPSMTHPTLLIDSWLRVERLAALWAHLELSVPSVKLRVEPGVPSAAIIRTMVGLRRLGLLGGHYPRLNLVHEEV